MSGRWEFPVTDANGDPGFVAFAAIGGCVKVSSPRTWFADTATAREIGEAWSAACATADWQRGQRPS